MKKHYYIILIAILTIFNGCKKFVDKGLPDQFDDLSFWRSEDNVRLYVWPFYESFPGYGNGTLFGDFYFTSFSDDQTSPSFTKFTQNVPASSSAWDFSNIRKANIMLERIDLVPMSDEAKNHWKGVARFFRALTYFTRVKDYGDVPWLGHSADIGDTAYIYKPRDPRTLVMDSVLADLDFACDNIRVKDQDNTINKYIALALKSRVCLYEGTWRKYHTNPQLAGADKFLDAAKDASLKVMNAGYTLNTSYVTTYNSVDLSGNKEVLLYKKYLPGFLLHSLIGYLTSSTTMSGPTKSAIDAYLCKDGLPISLSPLYKGEEDLAHNMANRDKRLLQSVDTLLCYAGSNNSAGRTSSTGYRPSKFLQPAVANPLAPYNDTDAPIFWLAEVLMNYAEAAAELNDLGKYTFSQNDLDISVNLLRKRAEILPLEYAGGSQVAVNGTVYKDPNIDPTVSSLIWEIRRERRVELMFDGFRYQDLMRWAKGDYMNTTNKNIWRGAKVPDNGVVMRDSEGYIIPYTAAVAVRTFVNPKNYFQPIPSGQIALYQNGNLSQNPGW